MSSPPTPNTSIKNVNLSHPKNPRTSSALASITALNPFRKKSVPDSYTPAPVNPYEVAPGIWNTDATAKAFGYIDTDDEYKTSRSKTRSVKRTKSNGRDRSGVPQRKPVTVSGRTTQAQIAYIHDSTGDSSNSTSANNEDLGRSKEQKDGAKKFGGKSQRRNRRSRMRTVDSDDRLTVRGANPRTGLVSPAIVSDNSDSSPAEDYVNIRRPPISRNRSGKWRAEGQGWSLVESPRLSPIAQSTHGQPSRQASTRNLQDKLLLEVSGVDISEPENMTEQRLREYQENLARIRKKEGSGAMVDPNTLPSPRACTPEGRSSPPNRLQKLLRRKPVANELRSREESADTVVKNEQKWASSIPTPRQESRERHHHRVRIVTPSNTPRDSSLEMHTEGKARTSAENPFLGLRQPISSQIANATPSPYTRLAQREGVRCLAPHNTQQQSHSQTSPQTKPQQGVHLRTHRENQNPSNENLRDPPTTLTLSQYLPRLQFMHPSHFANLEKPPSCRPTQTLPARLRPLDQQRKVVEDAYISTSTFTTTLNDIPARESRRRMQRQAGSRGVPKASHPEPEELREKYLREGSPMSKQPSCTRLTEESQGLRHGKTCHIGLAQQVMPQRDEAGVIRPKRVPMDSADYQTKVASPEPENAVRPTLPGDTRNQPLQGPQPRKRSVPTSERGRLRLRSANVMQENAPKRSYGDGCTPTYGHHGEYGDQTYREWGFVGDTEDNVSSRAVHPIDPTEYAVKSDGCAWFAGQWAEKQQAEGHLGSVVGKDVKALERGQPISKTVVSAQVFLHAFEDWLQLSAKLSWVQHGLYKMARHVLRTFQHNSPALTVLRSPNAKPQDYMVALKDVSLAVAYILVLLNVYMALRKLFMMAIRAVYWVCHPIDLVAVAFQWCVMM